MNEKNGILCFVIVVIIVFIVGILAGGFIFGNLFSHRSTGGEREAISGIAREITDGERRRLEEDQRVIEAVRGIARRNEEANSALRELDRYGGSTSEVLKVLRAKVDILQDEHNSLRDDLARISDSIHNRASSE